MGPLRGGVIALFVTTSPAAAAVCRQVRPGWSPDDGPATAFQEALSLLFAPWPLLTIVVILLALWSRKPILSHVAVALAVSLVSVLFVIPLIGFDGSLDEARTEGCVGPSYLRYVLALVILAGAIYAMARNWNPAGSGDPAKE